MLSYLCPRILRGSRTRAPVDSRLVAEEPDDLTELARPHRVVTARDALREATRPIHRRLESRSPLMSPALTLGEYAATLLRFHALYAVFERQIAHHAAALQEIGILWEPRRKLPLLRRDLEALGQPAPVGSRRSRIRLTTLAQALGCLYVLEGATLGGRLISHNVRSVLQLGPETGAAFFHGYGDAVRERWREFCAALELGLSVPRHRQQAVASAVITFEWFEACVSQGERSIVSRTTHA